MATVSFKAEDGKIKIGSGELPIEIDDLNVSETLTMPNGYSFSAESLEWTDLELETGVTAGTIGGTNIPKIRRVGDRVDIIGSVKVTWGGSSGVVVTTVPENCVPAGYQNTWMTTGTNVSGQTVAAVLYVSSTGTQKGKLRIARIQTVDGTNVTSLQEVVISTSYYVL